MEKFDIKHFLRFFVPSVVTLSVAFFLYYYFTNKLNFGQIMDTLKGIDLGSGLIYTITLYSFGQLLSSLYHGASKLLDVKINHQTFVQKINLSPILGDTRLFTDIQSVAAIDFLFYYYFPIKNKDFGDITVRKTRVESYFDYLHGLGACIVGTTLVFFPFLFYECSNLQFGIKSYGDILFTLLLVIYPLLIYSWSVLRNQSEVYVETIISSLIKTSTLDNAIGLDTTTEPG